MKTKIAGAGGLIAGLLTAVSVSLIAGPVTIPNAFTTNTTAKASEVNANFNAVATEVNDNDTRLITIESLIYKFGNNIFVGPDAGNQTMTGEANTAVGIRAFGNNTTGILNTVVGFEALFHNTTGAENTAIGDRALRINETGNNNTATGSNALLANSTGDDNTAVGSDALLLNTTGDNNTAVGREALHSNSTGLGNAAVGVAALRNNTSGGGNIAIGPAAGFNLTTGDGNIAIGNVGTAGESNTIRIGAGQTRAFIAGISGVTVSGSQVLVNGSGQLGVASSSRRVKDAIADMDTASEVLKDLRPVTFYYKSDHNPHGRTLQYGLVAEEVEEIAPELVARSANGKVETVYYRFLPPMLLNEYQKQQRTIERQAERIDLLEHRLDELAALLQ